MQNPADMLASADLTTLISSLPVKLLILLPDGPRFTIVTATDDYLRATERSLEAIVGRGVFEAFPDNVRGPHSEGPRRMRASLARVQSSGCADHLPMLRYDLPLADGQSFEERYWTPINTPVHGPDGRLRFIIHRVEDATDFVRSVRTETDVAGEPPEAFEARLQGLHAELLRQSEELRRANLELEISEGRATSLLANIAGMVFRADVLRPWRMYYASAGIERLTGFTASHFVESGEPFQSIVFEDDVERFAAELQARASAGQTLRSEFRIRRADRSLLWVEARARPMDNASGVFEGTVFDIDERKRAELALFESQENFRHTIQAVPSVLWTASPDGSLDFVSDAALQSIGESPESLIGRGWLEFLHPDDEAGTRQLWQASVNSGHRYTATFRLRNHLGGYWWQQALAECRRDQSGRILRWYGITNNIDELVSTQSRLRETEALANATVQTVPGVVWRARPDGALAFVSDASIKQFGWTAPEMIEDQWRSLLHPDDAEAVAARWSHSLSTGQLFESRHRFLNADGGYRWYQVNARAELDGGGKIVRWHGLATDIGELLQARLDAEAAARAKSAFLSTMSHEIRTPLNAVLGFAGLLSDTPLEPQQRDFVNSIRASGDHLLGVINDILDFSKLESGGISLDRAPCALRTMVESALDLVASQAAAKNLELLCRIDESVPAALVADQSRLRQVLANLLGNAVKFTAVGEVMVSVSGRRLTDDEFEFEFTVSDTGIGIPADRLDRLFRDFSQVDDSVSRRFGGTGLGLAISKRVVEAHGGDITVSSRVGEGSEFSFRIATRSCQLPEMQPTASVESLRGRRVLLVDDNRSNLEILGLLTKSWGIDVVGLSDPTQAPEIVRRSQVAGQPFELAILDHQMPDLDGLALSSVLQRLTAMPVLLLTSLSTTLDDARVAGAMITAVLTKPVHRSALFESLCLLLAPRAAITDPRPETGAGLPPLRLLLAEDNLVNRKVALLMLRRIGCVEIDVAINGVEAVEAVQRRAYDVVLMDMQMPVLDGLDATRRIRSELGSDRQPQIIAMTANAMLEDREVCIAAGMDDYLSKPIDPPHLAEALLRAAERRGLVPLTATRLAGARRNDADLRARRVAEQVLAGGGEMGAAMRRIDWSQTPLGPVYTWPQSLRTAISIVLSQKHPMFLWWGPELIQFYNDAYRPILGRSKHPAAIAQRGRDCWPDIWPAIGPLIEAAMERGESSMVERGLLCLYRNGFQEEGYFSYGYSPIRDESGGVGGILVACSENTADVLGERRSRLLLDLGEVFVGIGDRNQQLRQVQERVAHASHDLPFALVYELRDDGQQARLRMATGLSCGDEAAPALIVAGGDSRWPVFDCLREQRSLMSDHAGDLPALPPWPEPVQGTMTVPMGLHAALVVGLSPRLPLDAGYREFVGRLARLLGAGLGLVAP